MSNTSGELGGTLPSHACEQIRQVIDHDIAGAIGLRRLSERLVASGRMSPAELALQQRATSAARGEVIGYCADYCGVGGCALKGLVSNPVNSNPAYLNPENRAKYEFYQRVQEIEGASRGDYQY